MNLIKTKSFELATLQRGNPDSKLMALLMPGRLDTKDYANFVSHAKYLANRNFFVLAFDPPGTWESPGDIGLFTTTSYIKAVGELIEYFGNKPTLLLGHSRGATSAIITSLHNPAVIGIVSVMANFGTPTAPDQESIQRGYENSYRDMPPGTQKTNEKKEFKLPIAYWEDGEQYNAGETLKICTQPKLIIYGTKDEFTPPNIVRELYETIPEPKMIKEIISTHDYRYYPEAITEVNNCLGQFLNSYLL